MFNTHLTIILSEKREKGLYKRVKYIIIMDNSFINGLPSCSSLSVSVGEQLFGAVPKSCSPTETDNEEQLGSPLINELSIMIIYFTRLYSPFSRFSDKIIVKWVLNIHYYRYGVW